MSLGKYENEEGRRDEYKEGRGKRDEVEAEEEMEGGYNRGG